MTQIISTTTDLYWFSLAACRTWHSPHYKYRVAAVIVRNGVCAAIATNGEHIGGHAELAALSRRKELTDGTIYIARTNTATPMVNRLSRPCRLCFTRIRTAGIKDMVFMDERNSVVRKVVTLEDIKDYIPRQDLE